MQKITEADGAQDAYRQLYPNGKDFTRQHTGKHGSTSRSRQDRCYTTATTQDTNQHYTLVHIEHIPPEDTRIKHTKTNGATKVSDHAALQVTLRRTEGERANTQNTNTTQQLGDRQTTPRKAAQAKQIAPPVTPHKPTDQYAAKGTTPAATDYDGPDEPEDNAPEQEATIAGRLSRAAVLATREPGYYTNKTTPPRKPTQTQDNTPAQTTQNQTRHDHEHGNDDREQTRQHTDLSQSYQFSTKS